MKSTQHISGSSKGRVGKLGVQTPSRKEQDSAINVVSPTALIQEKTSSNSPNWWAKLVMKRCVQRKSQNVRSASQAPDQNYEGTRLGEKILAHSHAETTRISPHFWEWKKKDKQTWIKEKKQVLREDSETLLRVLQNKYKQLCFTASLPELTLSPVSKTPVTKHPSKSLGGEHQFL